MLEQCKQASGLFGMQANELVSRRCDLRCRSTELRKDLVVAADLPTFKFVMCRKNILHVNECHDTIIRSSSPVDGNMTFV